MLKSYSLFTSEIDVPELALADIHEQLSSIELLTNSIGILVCHYDHVYNGVFEALAKELPFPVMGYTTFFQLTTKAEGLFELTLTILTSDDISFATGLCADKSNESLDCVSNIYKEATSLNGGEPSLIMSFIAANSITGDEYIRQMDLASGGVPNFGAMAFGDKNDGENAFLLYGDKAYKEGFAALMFFGALESNFYLGNVSEEKLLKKHALVTKSDGVILKELDNAPATDFLASRGVILDEDDKLGLLTIPFLFRLQGSETLVARTMFDFNEKGEAYFFAEIPENVTFHIATSTTDEVVDVANATIEKAVRENPEAALILIFSCVGRYMALGMETSQTFEGFKTRLYGNANYLVTYTNGEICPIESEGRLNNMYHNYSIVICVLK